VYWKVSFFCQWHIYLTDGLGKYQYPNKMATPHSLHKQKFKAMPAPSVFHKKCHKQPLNILGIIHAYFTPKKQNTSRNRFPTLKTPNAFAATGAV